MANPHPKPTKGFKKGVSGNPGGRPKKVKEVAEYAKQYTIEAIDRIVAIMRDDDAPYNVRLRAAEVIIERACGKAIQPVSADVRLPERIMMRFPGKEDDDEVKEAKVMVEPSAE